MTPLLEQPLIKKYFGSGECPEGKAACVGVHRCMAYRILKAMQEPIKPGEKYIEVSMGNLELKKWKESTASFEYFCPQVIRLPDKHQPRCCEYASSNWRLKQPGSIIEICSQCLEKKNKSDTAKCEKPGCLVIHPEEPDPVEEKIKEIIETLWHQTIQGSYRKALRELVELARVPPKNG